VSTAPDLGERCRLDAKTPNAVIMFEVVEAYIYCAKALRRGGIWHPPLWPDRADMPSFACMLRDHTDA
jgi:predicted pyridoxine 5'-phosphate oxidase superfamily flavin-nucleotide-binding protein